MLVRQVKSLQARSDDRRFQTGLGGRYLIATLPPFSQQSPSSNPPSLTAPSSSNIDPHGPCKIITEGCQGIRPLHKTSAPRNRRRQAPSPSASPASPAEPLPSPSPPPPESLSHPSLHVSTQSIYESLKWLQPILSTTFADISFSKIE